MTNSLIDSNTIIIGAGPAGLSVGACLKQAGVQFIILEQSDKVGSVWRQHYDRLHLHTDKKNSELPFAPFPKDYPRYPSRDQLVDYLEIYTKKFDLDIRFNQQVIAARRDGNNHWEIQTPSSRYHASNLVVATGNAREPFFPEWKGQDSFKGKILQAPSIKMESHSKSRMFWLLALVTLAAKSPLTCGNMAQNQASRCEML
jgi:indole-3-pyruvate monooxygenase